MIIKDSVGQMTIEDNNDKQILSLNGCLFVDTVKVKKVLHKSITVAKFSKLLDEAQAKAAANEEEVKKEQEVSKQENVTKSEKDQLERED